MVNNKLKKIPKAADEAEEVEDTQESVSEVIAHGVALADEEAVEYDLLCGYTDSDGVKHTTFTLREMTGRDEEFISKPEMKMNPSKAINVLLSRCITSIGTLEKKDYSSPDWLGIIKSMYTGDLDAMLIKLRALSVGEEIEVTHTCPNPECKAKLNTTLNINELDVIPFKGETVIPFTLKRGYKDKKGVVHTTGTMQIATGLDREILTPLAKKNLAKANTVMLTRLCKFDDGTYVDEDVMASLVSKDREYLNTLLNDNAFGYDLSVEVTCDVCGESFKGRLDAVNFMR